MGPCEWPILPTCPDWQADPEPDSAQAAQQERAETMAVNLLWALTARVFGVCTVTVRPCFRPPDNSTTYRGRSGGAGPSFWPGLINGQWSNHGPCGCSSGCDCLVPHSMVALPGPVVSIEQVSEDGAILAPDMYRIKDNRWLVRTTGAWPQSQDVAAADDAEGAFTVRYRRGVVVPLAGQYAAGDLACEFLAGLTGGACALPPNAVSVARQGLDVQLLDPAVYLDGGMTGVPTVDAWVKSTNPGKAIARSKVYNVDTMGSTHRVRPGA